MYAPRFFIKLLECMWYFNFDAFKRPWYFYYHDGGGYGQVFYYKTGWDYLIYNKVLIRDNWNEHLDHIFKASGLSDLVV